MTPGPLVATVQLTFSVTGTVNGKRIYRDNIVIEKCEIGELDPDTGEPLTAIVTVGLRER